MFIATLLGCQDSRSPTEREREGVQRWLTCTECAAGELGFVVDSLGQTIVPLLEEALYGLDTLYRATMVYNIGSEWRSISNPSVDSATYVAHYLGNFDALVQRRAAEALGALGEVDILEKVLADSLQENYRQDVLGVIRASLVLAQNVRTGAGAVSEDGATTVAPDSALPLNVAATDGNYQTGSVGSELRADLVARVTIAGQAKADTIVSWEVRNGSAVFVSTDTTVAQTRTDADGYTRIRVRLGRSVGQIRIHASVGSATAYFYAHSQTR